MWGASASRSNALTLCSAALMEDVHAVPLGPVLASAQAPTEAPSLLGSRGGNPMHAGEVVEQSIAFCVRPCKMCCLPCRSAARERESESDAASRSHAHSAPLPPKEDMMRVLWLKAPGLRAWLPPIFAARMSLLALSSHVSRAPLLRIRRPSQARAR